MFNKPLKKTLYTLNVDNYAPEITRLTYPWMKRWAKRIGADFHVIRTRKWPKMPPVYEKLQIYELAQKHKNDWSIYLDGDALVHPETIDFTEHISKDTVMHNRKDVAPVRWDLDRYFLRDGRNIGSGNWLAIASDWCLELWKPLEDLTYAEALKRIHPIIPEVRAGIVPSHLIDDFTVSRNIAQYGLKFKTVRDLLKEIDLPEADFFHHEYLITTAEKVANIKNILAHWKV